MVDLPQLSDMETVAGSVSGKYVLVRGALNVPLQDGVIQDDFRLQKMLPTIEWLTGRGAKVILVGHLGSVGEGLSLDPVYEYLNSQIDVTFVREYADGAAQAVVDDMEEGEVLLFENLRQHDGEAENDPEFAQMLAGYADFYVNESFDVAHRQQASVVGVPTLLPSFAGLQFVQEVEHLSRAFDPERPFVFILGGVKFATKLPLCEKFIGIADQVAVGGAVANAYLAAAGFPVADSLMPEDDFNITDARENEKLVLPTDVVVKNEDDVSTKKVAEVDSGDVILDVGPETVENMEALAQSAAFVLWNGPLGDYEHKFNEATQSLAKSLASTAKVGVTTIVGGGDTGTILRDSGYTTDDYTFVSTAGGAMLDFLVNETLPGIEALQA